MAPRSVTKKPQQQATPKRFILSLEGFEYRVDLEVEGVAQANFIRLTGDPFEQFIILAQKSSAVGVAGLVAMSRIQAGEPWQAIKWDELLNATARTMRSIALDDIDIRPDDSPEAPGASS
jgi:hypothetical protein